MSSVTVQDKPGTHGEVSQIIKTVIDHPGNNK